MGYLAEPKFQKDEEVSFKPEYWLRAHVNYRVHTGEVGTVVAVLDPEASGPTYRMAVNFPSAGTLPYIVESAFMPV